MPLPSHPAIRLLSARRLRNVLAAIGFLTVLSVGAQPAEPLVFLGDSALPPYEFLDKGVARGANVDLALALGRVLGRPAEVRLGDWSTAPARLLAGECDVLTFLGRTPEREQQFIFGQSAMPVSFALFVRADETGRFDMTNLKDQRIGVTAGGLARAELQARHPETTLITADSLVDGIQKLVRREIDAFAAQEWSAYYLLSELGIQGITGLPPFRRGTGSFEVRRGDAALAAELDIAISQLKSSGEFDRIIDRWSYTKVRLVQQSTVTALSAAATVALAALLALSIALAVLHRRRLDLKREVEERRRAETALLRTQQQLRSDDQRKDLFLATLAHELRSPLAPISNAIELLQLGSASGRQINWAHQVIARQSAQLARLIDDLMDVSRIKTGKFDLRLEPLDMVALTAQALESAEAVIAQAGHRAQLRTARQPIWVHGDRARLAQVLGNLLTNAAKYMAPGGLVTVESAAVCGQAEIGISDTGAGIAVDQLEKVFEMFYQEGRSLKHAQGGLGVGLWLSRRLVLLHGGSLEAFSEGQGRGSRFVMRLPQIEPPALAPPPAARAAPTAGIRVLVVDDSADGAQTLAMVLEVLGYDVMIAARQPGAGDRCSIRAACRAARHRPARPRWLRSLPSHARQCLGPKRTADRIDRWGSEADKQAAKDAGFDAHLTKPAQAEDVEQLLSRVALPGSDSAQFPARLRDDSLR